MTTAAPLFDASLIRDDAERAEAMRLRYDVFVREMGASAPFADHAAGRETDRYDDAAEMLVLRDLTRQEGSRIVGVYRLIHGCGPQTDRFYSAQEYDLGPLLAADRRVLELGRSCLHPDYRGGTAMYHLWQALARYVIEQRFEVLFGVASFHGTDVQSLAQPLSLLHHNHLAPPHLRVRSRRFQAMDLVPPEQIDRRCAMQAVPALIKAYLRLGGFVGEGAFVDHDFNTIDVCLVVDTASLNARQRAIYLTPGRE